VPLRIIEIHGNNARAEIEGLVRDIRLDFLPGAGIGDYVIVHAGFAIEKLSQETAEENLRAIREVSDAVQR
jgi:hydrogenase expression/formation protein HypC